MRKFNFMMAWLGFLLPFGAQSASFDTEVAMRSTGLATYCVTGNIAGYGEVELMVDTGAGYTTINQEVLKVLLSNGNATHVRDMRAKLANGSTMKVPVYKVSAIDIGGGCWVHDIEAAVLPGKTRMILGLSALKKASPFTFSVDPPSISLSNCITS
jgi:predicted aspartyl protease